MSDKQNTNQLTPIQLLTKGAGNMLNVVTNGTLLVSSLPSNDTKIVNLIQSTHSHDARPVDVKPVLDVVEDILSRAHLTTFAHLLGDHANDFAAVDALDEKMGGTTAERKGTVLEEFAITIQKICCEFTCKCTTGDAHASAMAILKSLGNYSWDAKVVLTLAAFAVTYGELWLVMQLDHTNPLARCIASLKQTPERSEIHGVLRPTFAALNDITLRMVEVAKSLMQFRLLPAKYISPEDPPLAASTTLIAAATYWTIRSIIVCGTQIVNIGITSGILGSATEAWDLSSLAHKQKSIHEQLTQRLSVCFEFIEEKRKEEAYNNLLLLFKTIPKDNVRILKALIYAKHDIQPLMDISASKKQVHIDVLQGKTVLLFISDLDVLEEELSVIERIYKESRKNRNESQYEIVWLPIVDRKRVSWTREHENKFKELQKRMPWYSLYHPSLLDEVSIRFIQDVWGFAKKQFIVALNPMGQVVSQNAFHMMVIWGNAAYPFTNIKEEELWKKQNWKLDFVVNDIHPDIHKWTSQGDTHICLFGGEDIEWIRKFTASVKEHAIKTLGVKLELVYVGKHNAKEAMRKIMSIIKSENLAHTLPDLTHVWYFWTRLESMLYSKMLHGRNVDNDNIVKEVMSLMGFDGGDQGWGFIGKGGSSPDIVKGKGDVILSSLSKCKEWEDKSKKIGFLVAFWENIKGQVQSHTHHCNRVILPAIEGAGAPRVVACADCGRTMEKFILYRCCTG